MVPVVQNAGCSNTFNLLTKELNHILPGKMWDKFLPDCWVKTRDLSGGVFLF